MSAPASSGRSVSARPSATASLPDVPTVAEAGVPGYEVANWIGIVAPAGTPAAIVEKLNREIAAIQDLPEVQKQFANEGADVIRMSPQAFGAFMAIGNGQVGTRREGGRHQGRVTPTVATIWTRTPGTLATIPCQGMIYPWAVRPPGQAASRNREGNARCEDSTHCCSRPPACCWR